jgi:short-subunit dehydrogenase
MGMGQFEWKRALITGGGGGIGHAMARRFAAEGAEIVLADIDVDALDRARNDLKANGATCWSFPLDVTDPESIRALVEGLHEEVGRIDILVNNAGVVFGGPFLEVPIERHLTTYRVNVEGLVALTHALLGDLIASRRGHLVNIASASGFIGLPKGSTYASSKWAVIGFSESMRLELKHLGHRHVSVTTVCPSYVATGMFEGARAPLTTSFLTPEEVADRTVAAVAGGEPFVLEPWLVKITPFLKGALPTVVSDLLSDLFGATSSMEEWEGRAVGQPGQAD